MKVPSKRELPIVIDLTSDDDGDVEHRPSEHHINFIASTSPNDSIVEAAGSGDATWLEGILQMFEGDVSEAMMAAAAHGHFNCVLLLRDALCEPKDDEGNLDIPARQLIAEAVIPAARNGHTDVVELLLFTLASDEEINESYWEVFYEAAAHGHVDIVKLTAEELFPTAEFDRECNPALINAINGGHVDVVAFLLGLGDFHCDFGSAFVEAMNKQRHEVAERIYELYAELNDGENLFVEMAGRGRLDAVEYMYDREFAVLELVDQALANDRAYVVKFLTQTG